MGDYAFQSDFLAKWKSKSWYVLFVHSFIWTMCIWYVLCEFRINEWWQFFFLLIGHMLMDAWKCRGMYKRWNISDINSFYIDQTFHAIQLLVILVTCC